MTRSTRLRTFGLLALAALAIGVFVLVYRGPGRAVVRGHVGDVAATMLVYALLGLAWWRLQPRTRALAAFAIALAIECAQTVWQASSFAGELVLGTTFDPWDILAYAIGVVIAVAWERRAALAAHCSSTPRAKRCLGAGSAR